jgi:hypothetical protein
MPEHERRDSRSKLNFRRCSFSTIASATREPSARSRTPPPRPTRRSSAPESRRPLPWETTENVRCLRRPHRPEPLSAVLRASTPPPGHFQPPDFRRRRLFQESHGRATLCSRVRTARGRVGGRRLDRAARAGPTDLVSSRSRHRTVHAVLPHTAPRRSSPGAFSVPVAIAGGTAGRFRPRGGVLRGVAGRGLLEGRRGRGRRTRSEKDRGPFHEARDWRGDKIAFQLANSPPVVGPSRRGLAVISRCTLRRR